METPTFAPPTAAEIEQYQQWWSGLSDQWKQAFNEVMLNQSSLDDLPLVTMHALWNAPALRFAGPEAPYPNMSFELDNLDGVLALKKLEIFVFTYQRLRGIEDIQHLPQLKSLFIFENEIQSLAGAEKLHNLEEFFFQANQISSLTPISDLTKLHTIYCSDNLFATLEGIGVQHKALKQLFCTPNPNLPHSEVMRIEQELGIRVKGPL
jgi:Leucine-rich repeat (LRR) protein